MIGLILLACKCYAWPCSSLAGVGRCGWCKTVPDIHIPDTQLYARPLTYWEKHKFEKERQESS